MAKKICKNKIKGRVTRQYAKITQLKFKENNSDQQSNQQGIFSSKQNENNSHDSFISSQQQQSSSYEIKAENYAIKQMQFRQKRGSKMNSLINRSKEQQQDPFWQNHGLTYFGNLDDGDNDGEDYVQSSSGRDQFDSDFNETQSQPLNEEELQNNQQPNQQEDQKKKKKKQGLMRQIGTLNVKKKIAVKTNATEKKISVKLNEIKKKQQKISTEPMTRYIHQVMNQQQLLGEAAHTEYFNWISLQKLVSIEMQKKNFEQKQHHIDGSKIIYHDRIKLDGNNEITYELKDVKINKIADLSQLLK